MHFYTIANGISKTVDVFVEEPLYLVILYERIAQMLT